MKLLVIRHAIAEDISPTGRDEDRPLSAKGRDLFKKFCLAFNHLSWHFNLLLDSPLLRSQQTADIFCKYFSVRQRETSKNLKPLAEPSDLLLEIESYRFDTAVIFGHQPFLTKFISFCVTGEERAIAVIKRGAMAFLDFPLSVEPGSAVIKTLIAPKYLIRPEQISRS